MFTEEKLILPVNYDRILQRDIFTNDDGCGEIEEGFLNNPRETGQKDVAFTLYQFNEGECFYQEWLEDFLKRNGKRPASFKEFFTYCEARTDLLFWNVVSPIAFIVYRNGMSPRFVPSFYRTTTKSWLMMSLRSEWWNRKITQFLGVD